MAQLNLLYIERAFFVFCFLGVGMGRMFYFNLNISHNKGGPKKVAKRSFRTVPLCSVIKIIATLFLDRNWHESSLGSINRSFDFGLFSAPNVKGQDGLLDDSFLDFAPFLPAEEKQRYPVELLEIMNRLAEDRLLANSADQRGKDVLTFLASFPDEGPDVKRIKDGEVL